MRHSSAGVGGMLAAACCGAGLAGTCSGHAAALAHSIVYSLHVMPAALVAASTSAAAKRHQGRNRAVAAMQVEATIGGLGAGEGRGRQGSANMHRAG